ncbi:uncharacterized protein LOC131222600 isoform X3 [Magnolia sinica]|uniref:uncharacterized protein LOC131222600 isoform X3 n=1 Tax=Magnolia sinica TaxID=86752 RepID=UPI002658DCE8|nr:uncharacterized protein LOC131222600 isoform X3 [Magnolia sinica]
MTTIEGSVATIYFHVARAPGNRIMGYNALNQHHFARYMHRRSRRPLTSFLPREDCMYSRVLTGSSFLMRKSTTTSISSFQIEFATIIFYHLQGAQNPSNEQRIRDLHMRAPEEAV